MTYLTLIILCILYSSVHCSMYQYGDTNGYASYSTPSSSYNQYDYKSGYGSELGSYGSGSSQYPNYNPSVSTTNYGGYNTASPGLYPSSNTYSTTRYGSGYNSYSTPSSYGSSAGYGSNSLYGSGSTYGTGSTYGVGSSYGAGSSSMYGSRSTYSPAYGIGSTYGSNSLYGSGSTYGTGSAYGSGSTSGLGYGTGATGSPSTYGSRTYGSGSYGAESGTYGSGSYGTGYGTGSNNYGTNYGSNTNYGVGSNYGAGSSYGSGNIGSGIGVSGSGVGGLGGYNSYDMSFMSPGEHCMNRSPMMDVMVESLYGMWYGVEVIDHLGGPRRYDYYESWRNCIVVQISEPRDQPFSTETPLIHAQQLIGKFKKENRIVRMIWDESGSTSEYSFYFRNDSVGFWRVYSKQNGSLAEQRSYQQFGGSVQILSAVNENLVLHFCEEANMEHPAQMYTIILSREPGKIADWEKDAVHNLLQQKRLSVVSRRLVCGNNSGHRIKVSLITSVIACTLVYVLRMLS